MADIADRFAHLGAGFAYGIGLTTLISAPIAIGTK